MPRKKFRVFIITWISYICFLARIENLTNFPVEYLHVYFSENKFSGTIGIHNHYKYNLTKIFHTPLWQINEKIVTNYVTVEFYCDWHTTLDNVRQFETSHKHAKLIIQCLFFAEVMSQSCNTEVISYLKNGYF